MIKSFKHKGLKHCFTEGDARLLNAGQVPRIEALLGLLNASDSVEGMNVTGAHLHELKGDRKGVWSVMVSGNWRMTFRFQEGHAYDVNLEDYH